MRARRHLTRKLRNRMKSTVSVLLASSMVLNPMNGIQIAVGSEQDQTRIDISGLINKKVEINLDSDALKTAALAAIQESNVYSVGNYLSTDTATDAAFENLMNEENPFYELQLWSSEEEAQMAENGVDVKLLVQRDSKIVKEEQEDADAPATKSQLKKSNVSFMYDARDAKSGEELAFYQPGSLLGNLLTDFQADKLYHETAEAEESVDNSAYALTGDETLTILYMNTDKEAHTFKLLVDGKTYSTGIKVSGTESLAKDILSKLKKTIKEDLTGTTEAESLTTETAAETEESTIASQDNAGASDAATTAESTETTAAAQDNAVKPTTATAATETTTAAKTTTEATAAKETTAAETTKEETRTAEVRQEENTEKEDASQKLSKKESIAEAAIEEVKQLSGENTVTAIGAFTLDKFFDEAETKAVKTEEKAVEAENTADEDKTAEDSSNKEDTTEAPAEEGTTEASQDDTTAAEEETSAAASTTEADKTEESTTAVETSAETTEAETKAITAMDESLAEARKATLQTVTAKDIAAEITSAKLVQYSLGDITSEFKSADLGAYLVKVYPVTENAIEVDWKLEVKELLRDDQEAKADNAEENSTQMSEATKQALQDAGIYDNSRSLDIKLVDKDGKEVEPNGTVRVEIEMDRSLYDEADSTDLTFYHLEEEDGKITNVVQVADSSKTEALNAQGETIAKDAAVVTTTVENTEAVAAVSETEEESAENTTSTVEVKTFSEEVAKLKTSFEVESFSTYTWVTPSNNPDYAEAVEDFHISLYDYYQRGDKDTSTAKYEWDKGKLKAVDNWDSGVESAINKAILGSDNINNENYAGYFLLNAQATDDVSAHSRWVKASYGPEYNKTEIKDVVYQGIMKDRYEEGKLVLSDDISLGGLKSAANLFPTKNEYTQSDLLQSVMDARTNVKIGDNVFQVDDENSNHYVLNGAGGSGSRYEGNFTRFRVVETKENGSTVNVLEGTDLGSEQKDNSGNSIAEGFWPFGGRNQGYDERNRDKDTIRNTGFGMKLSFDFSLPIDGQVTNKKGQKSDMTFTFSGDDDVWVYLTKKNSSEQGRLALDIGGIHGVKKGSINFATGVISVEEVWNKKAEADSTSTCYWYLYEENDLRKPTGYTFTHYVGLKRPQDTSESYTLDFYYMERGGNVSNCYLDFVMPVIPSKGVQIVKNVIGEDKEVNNEHRFKLFYTEDGKKEKLQTFKSAYDAAEDKNGVKAGEGDYADISEKEVSITGAGQDRVVDELEDKMWFFVAEVDSHADKQNWSVVSSGSKTADPGSGTSLSTGIYQVTQGTGYRVDFTNIYGGLEPETHKRAWKDYNTYDQYDITLQVDGKTLTQTTTGEDGKEINTELKVENPVVEDKLSDAVAMVTESFVYEGQSYQIPVFYLNTGAVSGNTDNINKKSIADTEKGTKLTATKVESTSNLDGQKITYTLNGKEIVTYNTGDKTISWTVVVANGNQKAELGTGEIRTLTYRVNILETASGIKVNGDEDTGTHAKGKDAESNDEGYYSNAYAKLTYTDPVSGTTTNEKSFPHPIVVPYERKDGYVIVKKLLAGDAYSTEDNFTFKVTVDSADLTDVTAATALNIPSNGTEIDVADADFTERLNGEVEGSSTSYTITMKGDQYVVVKLPKAEGCTVSVAEVKKDGTVVSVDNEADNGYKLITSTTPDNQKLETDNLTLTYSFTNEKKVPNPTGVRTSGMAGVMAIVMGFGLMGLLSAGYVVNRRKRW